MEVKEHGVLVQIGVYDGNDEFRDIARATSPAKVILVEPNKDALELIRKSYAGIANVFIENVAITAEKDRGVVTLIHPTNDRQIAMGKPAVYNPAHFSLIPMDDWIGDMLEVRAESMTFTELCEKHGITHIDYLQIDTEGYDAMIITSIDLDAVSIDVIKYEQWNFPTEHFSRHGEDAKLYGVNAMESIAKFLQPKGYTFERLTYDIIATKQNEV